MNSSDTAGKPTSVPVQLRTTRYKYDLPAMKDHYDQNGLWLSYIAQHYSDLKDMAENPGKKRGYCPFHGGESGEAFRFFSDAGSCSPKSKNIGVCNVCEGITGLNLILHMEGKDKPDMALIESLADFAGMNGNTPTQAQPAKKKAVEGFPAASEKYYPRYMKKAVENTSEAVRRYLTNRGLSEIIDLFPKELLSHPGDKFMHDGKSLPGAIPALVGVIRDLSGEPLGCLRIYLNEDGTKLKPYVHKQDGTLTLEDKGGDNDYSPLSCKRLLKRFDTSMGGGSVHFGEAAERMCFGEGMESTLAARIGTEETAWSGLHTGMTGAMDIPDCLGVGLIFADKDRNDAGKKAAEKLANRLTEKSMTAYILYPTKEIPEGKSGIDWLDVLVEDGKQPFVDAIENLPKPYKPEPSDSIIKPVMLPAKSYQSLGFIGNNVVIINKDSRLVHVISYKSLTNNAVFLSIDSLKYWTGLFPKKNKDGDVTGPDWIRCIDHVIQESHQTGFYDPNIILGRGFAVDRGRLVRHIGDSLVVDGQIADLFDFDGEYTYEQTRRLAVENQPPLTPPEAIRIETACSLPFWKGEADPFLFLGFCALAPFCGALKWRSHLWITAPAGTGKSTWLVPLMESLIGKKNMVMFDNVSTEAGIRQTLNHDALPVLLEEAEAETQEDRKRLQRIIQYARNCSTDNDMQTAKGTPEGTALNYSGRSMFAYISTKDALNFAADKSRTTCLEICKIDDVDRVDEHAKKLIDIKRILDEKGTSERMIAYVSANWQTFQKNITTFSLVVGRLLNNSRHGDQYGTLLAGYWTITHQEQVSEKDACEFVEMIQLSAKTEDQDEQSDEQRCLNLIMAIDIKVDINKPLSMTISEAIAALSGQDDDLLRAVGGTDRTMDSLDEGRRALVRVLRRYGIIFQAANEQLHGCKGRGIYIANSHEYLKRQMEKTPFSNWSKMLKRIDGVEPAKKTIRFLSAPVRAVFVPL